MRLAALLLLSCAQFALAEPTWPGRMSAYRLQGLLADPELRGQLERGLRTLDSDPSDLGALRSIHGLAEREYFRALASQDPSLGELPRAAFELLSERLRPGERAVCREAHETFSAGHFLLATDRFSLCLRLEEGQGWLLRSVRAFQDVLVPAAVERLLKGAPSEQAVAYRALRTDILLADWDGARSRLMGMVALRARTPGASPLSAKEAKHLRGLISVRLSAARVGPTPTLPPAVRGWLESDPTRALAAIEGLYFIAAAKGEVGLREKYRSYLARTRVQRDLSRMARPANPGKASPPPSSRDGLVDAFEVEPDRVKGLALLRETGDSVRYAPAQVDQARAEALYKRGLAAYLREDIASAEREWRAALAADASHAEARRALERVAKAGK